MKLDNFSHQPMYIDVDTYAIYIINPNMPDNISPTSKFCINAGSALKTDRLIQSTRFKTGESTHNLIVVKLIDGDFIHYTYNVGNGAKHFWGRYINHDFVEMSITEYKSHHERFRKMGFTDGDKK